VRVDVVLWIVQWVLAVMFLVSGAMKVITPEDKLRADPRMGWVEDTGIGQARLAGASEVLAALGLVLPGLVGIAEFLTPLAALGLVVVMLLAAVLHRRRDEPQIAGVNLALAALAAFVAIGRFFVEPL
jgi:uncharacterized membrane protein YphA (DoxX/SURF4 family)